MNLLTEAEAERGEELEDIVTTILRAILSDTRVSPEHVIGLLDEYKDQIPPELRSARRSVLFRSTVIAAGEAAKLLQGQPASTPIRKYSSWTEEKGGAAEFLGTDEQSEIAVLYRKLIPARQIVFNVGAALELYPSDHWHAHAAESIGEIIAESTPNMQTIAVNEAMIVAGNGATLARITRDRSYAESSQVYLELSAGKITGVLDHTEFLRKNGALRYN